MEFGDSPYALKCRHAQYLTVVAAIIFQHLNNHTTSHRLSLNSKYAFVMSRKFNDWREWQTS